MKVYLLTATWSEPINGCVHEELGIFSTPELAEHQKNLCTADDDSHDTWIYDSAQFSILEFTLDELMFT